MFRLRFRNIGGMCAAGGHARGERMVRVPGDGLCSDEMDGRPVKNKCDDACWVQRSGARVCWAGERAAVGGTPPRAEEAGGEVGEA